jgi:mannose-6-phosphate isomerase-like protein (cupin superfamily)
MEILHADTVVRVPPGTSPDYNRDNPLSKLMGLIEAQPLGAGREFYVASSMQFLFPIERLELYGPSGPDVDILDPTHQDNKTDFQKQNVKDFTTADTRLVRGLVQAGDWSGPFLRLSYTAGPDSLLARAGANPGKEIKLYLKVAGAAATALIPVPYNESSARYEIEFWGYTGGGDLGARLDDKGRAALSRGELLNRPDLIQGGGDDFAREKLDGRNVSAVSPTHALHPILPLHIELAWANDSASSYDSNQGANHQFEFSMVLRGWHNFLQVGTSANPHGGLGFLEYRNLMSNYGQYQGLHELGRTIEPWNFDASGRKVPAERREEFFTVDYMDLHIVKPGCGIGLHRHRDNQEVFLLMEGRAFMVVGDWCRMPNRERCLEVRTLTAGHMALLKGGNLHALINPTDEYLSLFMFGGYD